MLNCTILKVYKSSLFHQSLFSYQATIEEEASHEASRSSKKQEEESKEAAMAAINYGEVFQFPDQTFPDDEVVGESRREDDEVMSWRNLPQNTWLRIMHQQDVNMECGTVKILYLLNRDATICKAWSTVIISKEIDNLQRKREERKKVENLPPAYLYIKCLGKRVSKSNPTRSYFDFKLMYF